MSTDEKKSLGRNYWKLWSATAISNLGDGVAIVAYPWLASAVTRSPLLIAIVGMVSRLPWLLLTLPAGVVADRFERKKIIVTMDIFRGFLTLALSLILLGVAGTLPDLDTLTSGPEIETNWALYWVIIISALLFGSAEVFRDNAAQTFLPKIVEKENLERANGRMWSAEYLMNSFLGAPLGSFLIGIAIALPFFFNATTFFIAVVLITLIQVRQSGSAKAENEIKLMKGQINFREEIREGFQWLMSHTLLRPMAIILGLLNLFGTISSALFILFAQEVLETSVFVFAILGTAGAVGGVLGGLLGAKISKRWGSGRAVAASLFIMPTMTLLIGLSTRWILVWIFTAISMVMAVTWNVITVSLRQSIIPDHLLGRVNSVYRFFAWGSIPIGMVVSGVLVDLAGRFLSREWSLRAPYLLAALGGYLLIVYAKPRLTTEKLEAARAQG